MTAQRPTEESSLHSLLPFWSLAGPYQGVKDRPAQNPNVFFLDIKNPRGRGTLGIFGWGCAFGTLEPLA